MLQQFRQSRFQRCILGYKLLALCWSDGRSQFVVDFSIHGERGKVDGKEQGLTEKKDADNLFPVFRGDFLSAEAVRP